MTTNFGSKIVHMVGAAVLACGLIASASAQEPQQDVPRTMVVFFNVESANLTPEAKTIVLRAVDQAERAKARSIELAAYASWDEFTRDPELAARRAAAVKDLITDYGFSGSVYIDEEAPDSALAASGDNTAQRSAILRVGG